MIDTITVPLAEFDLEGFIDAYREFYRSWAGDELDPDTTVLVIERFGDVPMPIDDEGRDLIAELTERGWLLFFQLHEPVVDDTVLCIDGSHEPSDVFDIGVADGYGFLVEVRDGHVNLHRALYDGSSGPIPSILVRGSTSAIPGPLSCVPGTLATSGRPTTRHGQYQPPPQSVFSPWGDRRLRVPSWQWCSAQHTVGH